VRRHRTWPTYLRFALESALLALAVLRRRRGPERAAAPRTERFLAPAAPLPAVPLSARIPLVLLPAVMVAGGVFFLTIAVPRLQAAQPPAPPTQPIAFDHRIHTQVAGLDCAFCHRTAATGVTAGLPDVQQCMDCHVTVGQGQPEVDKVRNAWVQQQAIDWQRVHRLPDHTRFTHDAHIQAGLACSVCHGEVTQMQQIVQVRPLKMADCVACHQQSNAPTECSTCHY
jgi:Cytochrome c7 and related cytochrome c/Class III cytochrome C family